MTETEYNIEVLCTCYSLTSLKQQCKKRKYDATIMNDSTLEYATIEELNSAISQYYTNSRFVSMRKDLQKTWEHFNHEYR